jgi:hypothetical protein
MPGLYSLVWPAMPWLVNCLSASEAETTRLEICALMTSADDSQVTALLSAALFG